jgi:hypothetical protein
MSGMGGSGVAIELGPRIGGLVHGVGSGCVVGLRRWLVNSAGVESSNERLQAAGGVRASERT